MFYDLPSTFDGAQKGKTQDVASLLRDAKADMVFTTEDEDLANEEAVQIAEKSRLTTSEIEIQLEDS